MKRILLVSILLIASLSCWPSENYTADLSTPEKTLKSYYEAFKTSDFERQKRTLESSIESIGKERFNTVRPVLQGHQILRIREAKDRKNDTFHLPEGDIDALVKETYRGNKESLTSFILREFENKWLIIGFDTVNESEVPPDIKIINEQAERMFEQKGKK
jgi:hypothetical protein